MDPRTKNEETPLAKTLLEKSEFYHIALAIIEGRETAATVKELTPGKYAAMVAYFEKNAVHFYREMDG